ncbi:AraC family transcriptional regulator [Arenicella xantha]|uniref:AraC family transcriptional regulator n=2 Tax=Arenicella xantha TaxID=644221 RepID=A0A395JMH1_9GAMM|nr:AraC family transcriptional regulator [Arenicella xantha]
MTAFLCLLFALLLLTLKSSKRTSNIFLSLFLIQQAAIPLDILISFGEEFRSVALNYSPNLFYFFSYGYWLEAPLLLWYVRSIIYKNYSLRATDLVLLVPFLAYLTHQWIYFYSVGSVDRVAELQTYQLQTTEEYIHWITLLREMFRVALGVVCLIELQRYRRHLRTNVYSADHDELAWLTILVTSFTLLRAWSMIVVSLMILSVLFGVTVNFGAAGLLGNYTAFLLVSLLIFYSLGHAHVHEGIDRDVDIAEPKPIAPEHRQNVLDYIEAHKPYTNTILTIDRLADQIGLPTRTLSNVINRQFNCNFYEFINGYRVNEATHLLSNHPEKTILEVMALAGFNSKATFNTFFKKKTGQTPSEFRANANKPKTLDKG